MNILIFINTLQNGGAEKQSVILYNTLKEVSNSYFVIFDENKKEDRLIELLGGLNYNIYFLKGNIFCKIKSLYFIFKHRQITHLFTYLTKPNFIGSIVAKFAGVKYTYGGIRTSKLPCWKIVLEKVASRFFCAGTIFNNYVGEAKFKKMGFRNTIVIPNCFYSIDKPTIRQEGNIVRIITVGRFVAEKDYETALRAIKELFVQGNISFKFQIIGYGKLEQQIRKLIQDFSMEQYVEIIINPNNIPELLKNADIYLSTSLFEGTSNSIMEAMNASLPIVATDVGDNNKLVFHSENGYLHNTKDHQAISDSLKTLLYSYDLRIKMGVKSNELLNKHYSFTNFKEQYVQLISK
jgi:glycosyltransferase involved in cell wall biosynthesis